MSGLDFRYLLSNIQRLIGIGSLVNVVAIQYKKTHLSAEIIELWYKEAVSWMRTLDHEPKTLSFLGVKGFKDVDGYSFAHADRKLQQRGFSDVHHISIYAASPPGPGYGKPRISTSLNNSFNLGVRSCLIWAWEQNNLELSQDVFLSLSHLANQLCSIDYAFALQDYPQNFPEAEGSRDSFMKSEKSKVIGYPTNKALDLGHHPLDFLRELYPYQIISPIHLSYPLGNHSLREWINSSDSHGILEPFSEDRWLWTIPQSKLKSVRRTLTDYHLLTLYLPDMQRILEDYARPSSSELTTVSEQSITSLNLNTQNQETKQPYIVSPHKVDLMQKLRILGFDETHLGYNPPWPLITLEDFFEGNDDYESIAPSLDNAELFSILKEIRARADVQDVLVEIYEIEVALKDEAAWPFARRIFFYTSAPISEIEKWNTKLMADGVLSVKEEKENHINPPILLPNYKTCYFTWD